MMIRSLFSKRGMDDFEIPSRVREGIGYLGASSSIIAVESRTERRSKFEGVERKKIF